RILRGSGEQSVRRRPRIQRARQLGSRVRQGGVCAATGANLATGGDPIWPSLDQAGRTQAAGEQGAQGGGGRHRAAAVHQGEGQAVFVGSGGEGSRRRAEERKAACRALPGGEG